MFKTGSEIKSAAKTVKNIQSTIRYAFIRSVETKKSNKTKKHNHKHKNGQIIKNPKPTGWTPSKSPVFNQECCCQKSTFAVLFFGSVKLLEFGRVAGAMGEGVMHFGGLR